MAARSSSRARTRRRDRRSRPPYASRVRPISKRSLVGSCRRSASSKHASISLSSASSPRARCSRASAHGRSFSCAMRSYGSRIATASSRRPSRRYASTRSGAGKRSTSATPRRSTAACCCSKHPSGGRASRRRPELELGERRKRPELVRAAAELRADRERLGRMRDAARPPSRAAPRCAQDRRVTARARSLARLAGEDDGLVEVRLGRTGPAGRCLVRATCQQEPGSSPSAVRARAAAIARSRSARPASASRSHRCGIAAQPSSSGSRCISSEASKISIDRRKNAALSFARPARMAAIPCRIAVKNAARSSPPASIATARSVVSTRRAASPA